MQTPPANSELPRSQARRFLGELPLSVLEQSGGLSGARVWRVESARGTFALRQYPVEFPTEERLRWLHGILIGVHDQGCTLLPCPASTGEGVTWIKHESHFWELLTWVHGEPCLETNPTRELLIAATTALAKLHLVTENMPSLPLLEPSVILQGVGRGLWERSEMARQWLDQDAAKVELLLEQRKYPAKLHRLFQLQQIALRKHATALAEKFQQAFRASDRTLPVLRDVQPEHVMFAGTAVAGFIDLAAARVDSAMADLARLLQRWRFAEPAWYADAVAAYHAIRPLENDERVVLDVYDYTARLLTGVQWLRWIVVEERAFANQTLVQTHLQRVEQTLVDLTNDNPPRLII